MVSEAITRGDVAALNYFVADKYMKVLAELADSTNQKMLIMPVEVTGVLGSLAGIAEIAKSTFGLMPSAMPRRRLPRRGGRPVQQRHNGCHMMAFIGSLGPWTWVIPGAVLLALELSCLARS